MIDQINFIKNNLEFTELKIDIKQIFEDKIRILDDYTDECMKILKSNKDLVGVKFISNFDRYYATVIYNFEKSLAITLMPDANNDPQAFIQAGTSTNFSGFMGPKNYKDL